MKKVILFAFLVFSFLSFTSPVLADECDDIPSTQDQIQKKIECLASKVSQLSSQANTLKNQINQFDAQIKLATVKITQTEEAIATLGGRIDQLKHSLDELNTAFSSRAVETYKMSRFENGFLYLFEARDIGSAVDRYHYLQRIQESDRDLIGRLEGAQNLYTGQKEDQESLQAELTKQKASLSSQKAAKNALLSATRSDESRYQNLLTQARAQLAAFRNFVTAQGGASILSGQTKCDSWGCYYNQREAEWGNIGLGGSSYSVASYGCLVTSISMIASHVGRNIRPVDIATNPNYFVPGTGYLYHSAEGMPFRIETASKSRLDSELSAGRPVIAGLYGGPDHFIVITKKEGDSYIMRDPFMENGAGNDGHGRPLTDKYSVGDITSLRLVSF